MSAHPYAAKGQPVSGNEASRFHRNHIAEAHADFRALARRDFPALPDGMVRRGAEGARAPVFFAREGTRYGWLVVVSLEGSQCSCRCDCGTVVTRTTFELNRSVRDGCTPRCADCLKQRRQHLSDIRRDRLSEAFRRQYVDYGTLWTVEQEAALVDGTRTDLEADMGPADADDWVTADDFCRMVGS